MAGRRGTMDSVTSSEDLDTFDEEKVNDFKPVVRFFRSPEEDLLVQESKDDPRSRRQSVAQMQRIHETSVGMLPSSMAKARRRSSVNRPLLQYTSPDFQAEEVGKEWETSGSYATNDLEAQLELDHYIRPEITDELKMALTDERREYLEGNYGKPADKEEFFRFGGPVTLADLKEEMRQFCTFDSIKRKIPIIEKLQHYQKADIVGDVIAGLTVRTCLLCLD